MDRRSVENKWIVDEGHQITGLVHPKTKKEAKSEMARLGISGSLHARSRFEKSPRYKAILLSDQRAMMKFSIQQHAGSLVGDYRLVKQLADLRMEIPEPQQSIMAHAEKQMSWCDKATKKQLDVYDPAADEWPT